MEGKAETPSPNPNPDTPSDPTPSLTPENDLDKPPKLSGSDMENTDKSSDNKNVSQTGDSTKMAVMLILLFVSGVELVGIMIYLKKRRHSK